MNEVLNQFEKLSIKNKIGHAYILYNVNYRDIEDQLDTIIYKYFFNSIEKESLKSDIYLIKPENNTISKDQIKSLQDNVKTCSQINDKKVYIIDDCDKMSLSAANSLLKFLEEPEKNIFAFLITSDIDKVLSTIISRCYKIFIKNKTVIINSDLQERIVGLYASLSNINDKDNVANIYENLKTLTRAELRQINEQLILLLKDFINVNHERKTEYYEYDKIKDQNYFTNEEIISKIILLNSLNERLNYNINIQMFIDKLVTNW